MPIGRLEFRNEQLFLDTLEESFGQSPQFEKCLLQRHLLYSFYKSRATTDSIGSNFLPALPRDLPKLQCIFVLYNYLTCSLNEGICLASTYQRTESKSNVKQRLFIVLLLLLSGNVQPNPELQCSQTPSDF